MTDPILTARLDVLEQSVRRAEERGSLWWESLQLQLPRVVQDGLTIAMTDQARERRDALEEIRSKLIQAEQMDDTVAEQHLLEEAWHNYAEVYEQCQEFFGECLEVLGGVALRDSGLEGRIYQLADDLINNCLKQSTTKVTSVAPTVPALPETLIKTLARIIGLRFPEWTIWTLPFAAHELGHVVMREDDRLQSFIDEEAKKWADGITKKRAENHLHEFLSDAFATYTMGPAYACAVVLLRFNPSAAHLDDGDHPADAKRAHVVFTMLERMNETVGIKKPYRKILRELRSDWQTVLKQVGHPDALQAPDAQRLEKLVDAIIQDQFKNWLRTTARYPYGEEIYGWLRVEKWYRTWRSQLEDGQPLDIKEVSSRNTLRDVLNAAWRCRLECRLDYADNPIEHADKIEKIEKIADAAHRLCEAIIYKRQEQELKERERKERELLKSLPTVSRLSR